MNIIVCAINSSINLYAQLAIAAKLRSIESRPSFSAGALRPVVRHNRGHLRVNLHWVEKIGYILRFWATVVSDDAAARQR